MIKKADLDTVYIPSPDVVARKIEGVIIIVPIVSGIGDLENELFSLNETGKAIWEKLDSRRTLKQIIAELKNEYQVSEKEIQEDIIGLASELIKHRMIIEYVGDRNRNA